MHVAISGQLSFMYALIQRVLNAHVTVNNKIIGEINQGMLSLIGLEKTDTEKEAKRMIERILGYRIFSDENQNMNLSLKDVNGGLLIVPQFTLAADTQKGMRPSFSSALEPSKAKDLFASFVEHAKSVYPNVACGEFGADMKVHLVNDGPVTFMLRV